MLLFKTLLATAVAAVAAFPHDNTLKVSSTAFTNNGFIPSKYSCDGEEASPPLSVTNIPGTTKSLALIVHDPDAPRQGGFTHWVVWNIPPANASIDENFKGAMQGLNGASQPGYKGMCPPTGAHHYHFKVYALDDMLTIDSATGKAGLEKSMEGHILASGELVGLYQKTKQ